MLDMTRSLDEQCSDIVEMCRVAKAQEDRLRREPPIIRIWDGDYNLQHSIGGVEYMASFQWISNDTGPGQIEIPFEHPAAQWIHDSQGRIDRGEGRAVHITVDYCGVRWSGRLDKSEVESRDDGDDVMVLSWVHDYENLKFVTCWSNPYTRTWFQFPRAFLVAGPIDWCLLTTLQVNLMRMHKPTISVPDDPLHPDFVKLMDQSDWPMVIKPLSFVEAAKAGSVWGMVSSRFATWHDIAKVPLEDAELSVVCTRYLDGDEKPWPSANIRHGTLVISIEDKSGTYVGTSQGGDIWTGLRRTVAEFSDDFLDSTLTLVRDAEYPTDYFLPGFKNTNKESPYVVYRTGETSGIETSKFINSPAKAVTVTIGGHSAPGVNEVISATIQGIGDLLGQLILIGGLGGAWDQLLQPLYEDVLFAWNTHTSKARRANAGWAAGYTEYFMDGANKAYTIAALMVLRAGFWSTKTVIANQMQILDASPFLVGGEGIGHWFLDDRIGFSMENDPSGQIWVDRARKIELKWDNDTYPEWLPTIGDPRNFQDPAQRAWGKIEQMIASLRDLGVY